MRARRGSAHPATSWAASSPWDTCSASGDLRIVTEWSAPRIEESSITISADAFVDAGSDATVIWT
jgi:hypothetical protein